MVESILTKFPSISEADHVLPVRPDVLFIICRLGTILKNSLDTKTGPQRDRLIADLPSLGLYRESSYRICRVLVRLSPVISLSSILLDFFNNAHILIRRINLTQQST